MKKYIKEIIISILQLLLFYIFPMFVDSSSAIGMVFSIIIGTFILSLLIGILSNNKIKYFYSILTAIIFIPSVFIYYNESAFIHSLWYLVIASIGLFIGSLINKMFYKKTNYF